jgi:thiol:disulfide interchange protein
MTPNQTTSPAESTDGNVSRLRNLLIALSAVVLAVVLFLGMRVQTQKPSLTALATASVPLDSALVNGQPTLLEFYADWCTSCQAMAADMTMLKQQYKDVNFVMLNVDNTKWLPEISRFGVDGIPHFVFLNRSGEVVANVVGQQPRTIMAGDLAALSAGQPLPEQQILGQVSALTAGAQPRGSSDPRSHGGLPAS